MRLNARLHGLISEMIRCSQSPRGSAPIDKYRNSAQHCDHRGNQQQQKCAFSERQFHMDLRTLPYAGVEPAPYAFSATMISTGTHIFAILAARIEKPASSSARRTKIGRQSRRFGKCWCVHS